MIKYICKKCNINTETSICPVCGERAEVESSTIYWCDDCNIPLYDEICPICGKKAHRIGSDLRPVFPEERLLLEVMLGEPFKYKNLQIACVGGNQCKGSVFSGGSIVEKTGEKALKRTKTCLTRCNAERKRDRKIAKPDRNAIADSVDQNLAGK